MELPTKAPPRCLPAPAIFATVGGGRSRLLRLLGLWLLRRVYRPQAGIGAGVEGVLKLLGVDLAVLVQ